VEAEAHQLGLTVVSACAVFDPELVVLGGGVGSNPLLLPKNKADRYMDIMLECARARLAAQGRLTS